MVSRRRKGSGAKRTNILVVNKSHIPSLRSNVRQLLNERARPSSDQHDLSSQIRRRSRKRIASVRGGSSVGGERVDGVEDVGEERSGERIGSERVVLDGSVAGGSDDCLHGELGAGRRRVKRG